MLLTGGEIKRTKFRFVLLTIGAGLLVFVLLFQQLLLDGVLGGLTGALRKQSGTVMVFSTEAKRNLQGSFAPSEDVQRRIRANPKVAAASDLSMATMAFKAPKGDAVKDAMIFGYHEGQPGMPERASLVAGRYPAAPGEVLADLESAPGWYELEGTVLAQPNGQVLRVVGLTEDARYNVSPTFWMRLEDFTPLARAADSLYIAAPKVMVLQPAQGITPKALAAELAAAFPTVDVMTRQTAAETAPGINEIRLAFGMILGLGYLVVGIVIGFFFLTLTLQKKASITLLRAVGAPNRYLVISLLQQVLLVTLGGVGVGLGLLFVSVPVVRAQVPLTPRPLTIAIYGGMALGVALLGAIPPMRRILRTDPYDVVGRPSLGGLG